jgi:hypothetical protein
MEPLIKGLFIFFSSVFTIVGMLMLVVPAKYPSLYVGFLRGAVIRREATDRGKRLATRMHGLVYVACGALFALFTWAIL